MDGAGDGGEEDEAAAVARARAVAAAMKSNQAESGAASAGGDSLAAAMAELDMEHYDSEGDEGAAARILGGSGNPGALRHGWGAAFCVLFAWSVCGWRAACRRRSARCLRQQQRSCTIWASSGGTGAQHAGVRRSRC